MTEEHANIDLEIKREKLEQTRLENARLRKGRTWRDGLAAWVPVVTSVIAVAGLLVGVHQFNAESKVERQAQMAVYQSEEANRQSDFRKRFWEERLSIYAEITDLAAKIAIEEDIDTVSGERSKFWSLYWGRLSLLESRSVYEAMIEYGKVLSAIEGNEHHESGSLRPLSYILARACRESLKETWEPVALDDLPTNTFLVESILGEKPSGTKR